MKTLQKGFTLIELMIVVAIIGILAAVALPMYQDFQVRSRVSEVLGAMAACKTTVTEFYASNNGWATPTGTNISAIGAGGGAGGTTLCATSSQYVAQVLIDASGRITATTAATGLGGNPSANNMTITMEPRGAAGVLVPPEPIVSWVCGSAAGPGTSVPAKYRPGSCQG